MILLEKTEVMGLEPAIRGMRNPMNSWDKSNSGICKGGDSGIGCRACSEEDYCNHTWDNSFHVGKNDHELMIKLVKGGPVHAKFRRMITVYVDITAPLYWWKEFDTYKVGTVANSCSTMHKIHEKEFEYGDFSCEHLISDWCGDNCESFVYYPTDADIMSPQNGLEIIVKLLNANREAFMRTGDKKFWWQMIQLLPSSYNQKRTVMLNYEVLAGIYQHRNNHKLDEWRKFCQWIEELPYSEIVIREVKEGYTVDIPVPLGTPVFVITEDVEKATPQNPFPRHVEKWRFTLDLLNDWDRFVFDSYEKAENALRKQGD